MNIGLIPKLAYLTFICLTIVLVGCDSPDTEKQAEAYQNEILQEAIAAKAMAEASLAGAET